jgi:hypothetical protein
MGYHPINLALRFLLELAALYFIGRWGWVQYDGIWRYILAIGLPLVAATIWGVFRVPDDGGAPVVRALGRCVPHRSCLLRLRHLGAFQFRRHNNWLDIWQHHPSALHHFMTVSTAP